MNQHLFFAKLTNVVDPSISTYHYHSPAGVLEISANDEYLLALKFLFSSANKSNPINNPVIELCVAQLDEFFEGKRLDFNLPLKTVGTEFQRKVWNEVRKIPLGKTMSYLEVARKLGDESAVRSVGAANGKNPYHIIVPCHRVVGENGDLVGYAGGINRKKWLLDFENKITSGQMEIF